MRSTNQSELTGQGIQLFTNPTFGEIRTTGTPENPQFCLKDLCSALDLAPRVVKQRLSEDVCSTYPLPTAGGIQMANFVNEDGLYDVILDSRKPEARQFRKWITSEVLPSIRKTGGYIKQEESDTEEDILAKALLIAQKTIEDKKAAIQQLEGEKQLLQEENAKLSPKAEYADQVLQSRSTITLTELAKEMNYRSVHAFTKQLNKEKILFRIGRRWLPYARYSGLGLFATRTYNYCKADGRPATSVATTVTEKGRKFIHEYFNFTPVQSDPIDIFAI